MERITGRAVRGATEETNDMDGKRLDDLARRLGAAPSRRGVLRALAGIAAGGALAVVGRPPAGAQACRGAGRLCAADAHCCSGFCDTANPDPVRRNRCACPPGQENCRGACNDLATDVLNCGGCGIGCPDARQVCGHLLEGGTACCYPPGTAGVCHHGNFSTVCCAVGSGGVGTRVGCSGGTCF
jgi:hypothetical protein